MKDCGEYWCETCRCVHPVQKPGSVLQPCPTCSQEMTPTNFNLRLIDTLRKDNVRLHEQIEQLRRDNKDLARAAIVPSGMVLVKANSLLAVRDALVDDDVTEAYHQLYWSVDWADPYKPFAEWEAAGCYDSKLSLAEYQILTTVLREALEEAVTWARPMSEAPVEVRPKWFDVARRALALPTDDTALQQRLSDERERCAKVCDPKEGFAYSGGYHSGITECAAAIRAIKS